MRITTGEWTEMSSMKHSFITVHLLQLYPPFLQLYPPFLQRYSLPFRIDIVFSLLCLPADTDEMTELKTIIGHSIINIHARAGARECEVESRCRGGAGGDRGTEGDEPEARNRNRDPSQVQLAAAAHHRERNQ